MEEAPAQILETCSSCGAYMDVSAEEPYALVHCPSCGTATRVRRDFAHFTIQDMLGEGGQGRVYKGLDTKLGRPVAIKVMRREFSDDPEFVKRFESEARITASLNHPNIVKVFSFGSDLGLLYLAMELVDKASLETLIEHHAKVPEVQVLDVGIQIAKGLKAGLEKGLLHRDLKPGNILFSDAHTPKLVDFGLAILIEKQAEETGDVWATPYYVPPEKLDGRPEDFRSDMYSLAATLFHALAGRPPFLAETSSMSELRKIKSKPVHINTFAPELSTPTAFCIDRALSVEPEKRYASYDEFIEHLEFAKNELLSNKNKHQAPEPVAVPQGGSSMVTYLMLALVLVGGLGYYFLSKKEPEAPTPAPPVVVEKPAPKPTDTTDVKYIAARDLMLDQKYPEAAAAFARLFDSENVAEPYRSASGVHLALCDLLMNKEGEARAVFSKIAAKLAPDSTRTLPDNVEFFRKLASLGMAARPVKITDAAAFKRDNAEAIALLILGLKNWEMQDFASAIPFLNEFQKVQPTRDHAWLTDYRIYSGAYLGALAAYRAVAEDLVKSGSSLDAAAAALQKIPATKEQLRITPSLIERLSTLEREHAPKIEAALAARTASQIQSQAAQEQAEGQGLGVMKQKVKQLCDSHRFTEALAMARGFEAQNEKYRQDRDLVAQRVNWLVQFKAQLVKDVNAAGYLAPLTKRNGQQLIGGIVKANDTHVELRVAHGTFPVLWTDLSAESILKVATSYFAKTPPEELNDKRWRTGVFCLFMGKVAEGIPLLEESAAANEEYRTHQALFFGKPTPDATTSPETEP